MPAASQRAHQLGHAHQVLLLDLNEAQVLHPLPVEHGLHGSRLAGSAVAEEQHIVGRAAGEEQTGVVQHLLALLLIAEQLNEVRTVRIGHRDQMSFLPQEGPVPGVQAAAILPVEGGKGLKIKGDLGLPLWQALHHGGILLGQGGSHSLQIGRTGGAGQVHQGLHIPAGSPLQHRVFSAQVYQSPVGVVGVAQLIPQPITQAGKALPAQLIEHFGISVQSLLSRSAPAGLQKLAQRGHQRGFEDGTVNAHAAQSGGTQGKLHGFSLLIYQGFPQF